MSIRILGIPSGPYCCATIPPRGWTWRVVRRDGESRAIRELLPGTSLWRGNRMRISGAQGEVFHGLRLVPPSREHVQRVAGAQDESGQADAGSHRAWGPHVEARNYRGFLGSSRHCLAERDEDRILHRMLHRLTP